MQKTLQDIFADYLRSDQVNSPELAKEFARRAAQTPAEEKYELLLGFMTAIVNKDEGEDTREFAKTIMEMAFGCQADDDPHVKIGKACRFFEKIAHNIPSESPMRRAVLVLGELSQPPAFWN